MKRALILMLLVTMAFGALGLRGQAYAEEAPTLILLSCVHDDGSWQVASVDVAPTEAAIPELEGCAALLDALCQLPDYADSSCKTRITGGDRCVGVLANRSDCLDGAVLRSGCPRRGEDCQKCDEMDDDSAHRAPRTSRWWDCPDGRLQCGHVHRQEGVWPWRQVPRSVPSKLSARSERAVWGRCIERATPGSVVT